MTNTHPQSEPITLVISEVVKPGRIPEYEIWTRELNMAASQFEGFLGVDVIRPRDSNYPEYVVIVKFDRYTHFRVWLTSPIYKKWLKKARDLIVTRSHQQQSSGLVLWFTLPSHATPMTAQPAYYKMVILGTLSVYPLILLINALLNPFLKGLPPLLSLLISVTVLSALLTYPVMPWLSHLLRFWLYPSPPEQGNHR